jgi:sulfate adenylyltransferase subunit 2
VSIGVAPTTRLDHLEWLESEAIYILREVAAQSAKPALLFSGGKDSCVVLRLAEKAFRPGPLPFPLLHIDTGHNFPETLVFRDRFAAQMDCTLIARLVQDSIDRGRVKEETGPTASRNALQTVTLLDAIKELGLDCAIGGARRDEEKARAKERVFSHRDYLGQWDPKNQRPELWNLYNGRKGPGEHFRVFPLSNWTELDVWQYIEQQGIPLPDLYFAHRRPVFHRDGMLLAQTPFIQLVPGEVVSDRLVRFRTVGDATCTGAVESGAATIPDIIQEIAAARVTERGGRSDDKRSDTAMEDRKRQGYF